MSRASPVIFCAAKWDEGNQASFEGWQSRANREGMGAYNQDALRGGYRVERRGKKEPRIRDDSIQGTLVKEKRIELGKGTV
jgi:hypothetical protein